MPDIPREHPAEPYEKEADHYTKVAGDIAHEGHNGHGSDDRAGYGAIAQVHALLSVGAEIRAHSLRTEDALITMLDRDPDGADTVLGRIMAGPPLPPGPDPAFAAVIGLVLFMVVAVVTAGVLISWGQGPWSVPLLAGAATALFMVERRLPR